MAKKYQSIVVVANDDVWINITAIGYLANPLMVAMIGGCSILHPRDEKNSFIKVSDAIKLNRFDLENPGCRGVERRFRELNIIELERLLNEHIDGIHTHSFSREYKLALIEYLEENKSIKAVSSAIKTAKRKRPDLFPSK